MKRISKTLCIISSVCALTICALPLSACSNESEDVVTLRVSNWEEYIDLGDWDEEDLIEIDNPYADNEEKFGVIGENSVVDDFKDWFKEEYGFKVEVDYSTFGTNEDLYNRLNLGDVYDLVCPSDYLIMQLLREDKLEKYSEGFFTDDETNYYTNNVSPFIQNAFATIHPDYDLNEYAAGYMWGTTGFIYNPDLLTDESDVLSWQILENPDYRRAVTIKDNVRDSYFAALGAYAEKQAEAGCELDLNDLMNNPTQTYIDAAEDILKSIKDNVYSFETDSGKADMITGKVAVNFQWSGDGVYILDQAQDDENNPTELWYAVPENCTNLWFDGWVMLKDGINGDEKKRIAAEAFVNFISRPDNAVRNMDYIGYTSSIASDVTFDYLCDKYADEENGTYKYDLSYFFGEGATVITNSEDFIINEDGSISHGRQLFAQYPPKEVTQRSIVMRDFTKDELAAINQMWINVRCLDVKDFNPAVVWPIVSIILAGAVAIPLIKFRDKIFVRRKKDKE